MTWTSTLPPHASRTSPHHSHSSRRDQQAQPRASVLNNCSFPIYLWSVADSASPAHTLSPYTGTYSEAYQQRANGGISLKVAPNNSMGGNISQFEYTVVPSGPYTGIFWDLSHVNGDPFGDFGEEVSPSVASSGDAGTSGGGGGSCQTVTCAPGVVCHAAYINPNDNEATHSCPLNTDLTYTVCSGGNETVPDANTPTGASTGGTPRATSPSSEATGGSSIAQNAQSVQPAADQQPSVHVVEVTKTVQAVPMVQTFVQTLVQSPNSPWMTLVPDDGSYALAWSAASGDATELKA